MESWVTAIATGVIAIYATVSSQSAKKRENEIKDLFQAIVIATLGSGSPVAAGEPIEYFKKYYKGKTKIFD